MTTGRHRVAIVFPADAKHQLATSLGQSRFADIAGALGAVGIDVVGAPYADAFVHEVRALLLGVDGVLVWFNPIEVGRDRTLLNAMLRDVAAKGAFVSAHPDVIDRMGTKEVLYGTRSMGWGADTRHYGTTDAMRTELAASLGTGAPRVLKQIRGHSGDGVWKVELADPPGLRSAAQSGNNSAIVSPDVALRVRHAKRGSTEEQISLAAFVARCQPYFAAGDGMIDQPYQARLPEGMVRCYLVGDKVAGFGEQLVNALYPAPPGAPPSAAPQPGQRHYFPPTRADFQRLKDLLERAWIGDMCRLVGLERTDLPTLWDADFLFGPKDAAGADTYVLCEINVSSVYPFPPDALEPLVAHTLARLAGKR